MSEKVGKILKATHSGEINVGNTVIPCYVLEDGTRVITQTGAVQSLGMSRFLQLHKLASRESLKPFINAELSDFLNWSSSIFGYEPIFAKVFKLNSLSLFPELD